MGLLGDYSKLLKLNEMWKSYMATLLDGKLSKATMMERVLKANYNGCLIEVTDSNNKELLGLSGIVILETKNTFIIVTKSNQRKMIVKSVCKFGIEISSNKYILNGKALMHKASDRSKIKLKPGNN